MDQALAKDEVGFWPGAREIARNVLEELAATGDSGHVGLMLAQEVVLAELQSMHASFFPDCFVVTEHPALGTTCHVTLTFLPDKFREHLAAAAHERQAVLRAGV